MFRRIYLALILVVSSSVSAADEVLEVADVLNKLQQSISKLERYHLQVRLEYFAGPNRERPLFEFVAEVKRYDDNILYMQKPRTMLTNSRRTIVVDEQRRQILVNPTGSSELSTNATSPDPGDIADQIRDAVSQGAVVRIFRTEGGLALLEFEAPGMQIEKVGVYVDPDSGLLHRVTYTYRPDGASPDKGLADIRYRWLDASLVSAAEFKEELFIRNDGRVIHPASQYANYEVITIDNDS